MSIIDRAVSVPVRPWLVGQQRDLSAVGLVVLHFTGSGLRDRHPDDLELEYDSSVNWLNSPSNHIIEPSGYEWGGAWNLLVSQTRLAIGVPLTNEARHGCGIVHDLYSYNVELTMPDWGLSWPDDLMTRAAAVTAELCRLSRIEVRYLPFVDSINSQAPGITSHMDTSTGQFYGKKDFPRDEFPWTSFITQVTNFLSDAGTPPLLSLEARLEAVEAALKRLGIADVDVDLIANLREEQEAIKALVELHGPEALRHTLPEEIRSNW